MTILLFGLVVGAIAVAIWQQIFDGQSDAMASLGAAALQSGQDAVTLGIALIATMAIFMGLMKVAEAAGATRTIARGLRPMLVWLFPEIPADDPALGAMTMNVAVNVVGVSNAATPFGLRAMRALAALNPIPDTASDAMVLFLAINTANVTLLPTHVLALRTAVGSHNPAAIVPTTLFATIGATLLAIVTAKLGNRWRPVKGVPLPKVVAPPSLRQLLVPLSLVVTVLLFTLRWGRELSPWILPMMFLAIFATALWRRVDLYGQFLAGARQGLLVSFRILPALIVILMAIGMMRASGAMDLLLTPLGLWTQQFGLPPEALTMAVLRSLSGSASFGYLGSLLQNPAIGPDSYCGILVSTLYGSSETTFYVLAVYFGAVGVRKLRHALVAGLVADGAALLLSVVICRCLYGG